MFRLDELKRQAGISVLVFGRVRRSLFNWLCQFLHWP